MPLSLSLSDIASTLASGACTAARYYAGATALACLVAGLASFAESRGLVAWHRGVALKIPDVGTPASQRDAGAPH